MRQLVLFFLLTLQVGATARAQSALLQRRVQLTVTNQPLGEVLREMARQSNVEFSYSSTLVPLQSRITLRTAGPQPLYRVLAILCEPRGLSWQLMGSHLVVWRTTAGPPPLVAATGQAAAQAWRRTGSSRAPQAAEVAGSSRRVATSNPAMVPGIITKKPLAAAIAKANNAPTIGRRVARTPVKAAAVARNSAASAATRQRTPRLPAPALVSTEKPMGPMLLPVGSGLAQRQALGRLATDAGSEAELGETPNTAVRQLAGRLQSSAALAATIMARAARRVGQAVKIAPLEGKSAQVLGVLPPLDTLLARVAPARPSVGVYYEKQVQATLVSPLGTNGLRSGRTNTEYSLNVLAGYNAGVRRLEIGGLLNVVRDTVRGVQMAGLANVVGTDTQGVQAAGLVNILGGSMRGVQLAGLANIIRDDARGVQVAGLVNVVGGAATAATDSSRPVRLRRWLGLPRLLATDPVAATPGAAGQPSLRGPLVQAAGLANLTGTDVRGLQAAPLLNIGRRISGVQLGVVNVAKRVSGLQIGLVNVADSVSGAGLLGILNIVRRGGYRRGEVWASETLPLNAVLKLGVPRYYTILGAATQPLGTRVRWAGGFGIGTASASHGRFTYSLDLLQWALTEPGEDINGEIRLLTQLRPALAWQIETNGHLQLVVSPTLNLALATNTKAPPTWDFGNNQLLLLNTRSAASIYRLWPGLQIGLRF